MKKIIAMLLMLCLVVGLMAGCSGSKEKAPAANTPAAVEAEKKTETEKPAEAEKPAEEKPAETKPAETEKPAEEKPAETPASNAVSTVTYPLVTEPFTFTAWWPNELSSLGVEDYNERYWFSYMEEKTGVHIDFSMSPSTNAAAEQYNLMLVSGDIPDFVYKIHQYHTKGLDNAVDDEWYFDMADYLEYLPYMKKVMVENEEMGLQAITDSGYLAGLPMLVKSPQTWVNGLLIRQDLLDKLGLATPETISELENFLVKAVENEPNCSDGALWMNVNAMTSLEGAFGVGGYNSFLLRDGAVRFSPLEDGYREYLETMIDWYSKGLIDTNFAANGMLAAMNKDKWYGGGYAVCYDCFVYLDNSNLAGQEVTPGLNMVAYACPSKDDGSPVRRFTSQKWAWAGELGIATTCPDVELACKYWDYGYSDEAFVLANYGPEDVTMYFDENGDPHYTDFALNPTGDGWSFNGMQKMWMLLDAPFYRLGDRETYDISDAEKACGPAWTKGDTEYALPGITTTSEEGETKSRIMSDIQTYVVENQALFITGQKPISELDSFFETIESMGIDEVLEIYEAGLKRYENRKGLLAAMLAK